MIKRCVGICIFGLAFLLLAHETLAGDLERLHHFGETFNQTGDELEIQLENLGWEIVEAGVAVQGSTDGEMARVFFGVDGVKREIELYEDEILGFEHRLLNLETAIEIHALEGRILNRKAHISNLKLMVDRDTDRSIPGKTLYVQQVSGGYIVGNYTCYFTLELAADAWFVASSTQVECEANGSGSSALGLLPGNTGERIQKGIISGNNQILAKSEAAGFVWNSFYQSWEYEEDLCSDYGTMADGASVYCQSEVLADKSQGSRWFLSEAGIGSYPASMGGDPEEWW